ncbi:hypothetical protein GCM10007897_24750 [Sphingobium jiangsuense]|uniref:DUF4136 domain-containing protein n=1 Tax=Sphingobium jiangsuense TaxID=870476 RepID=A0A7W6BMC1_9SPHN|nr:DUF4136 domain-containing protein [Sphingobium jiangsuense]MBB3928474.1 hypothetical protein [Sphingobium jiangsuense]GLT01084.1 hypothetical protein GCM10007897_24750 [Sphingobium jiangsuense]
MSRHLSLAVMAMMGGLALSGCAASIPPVEVTRFHAPGAAVPRTGGIVVEPQPGPRDDSIEYRTFAGAVAQELQRVGFTDETGRQTLRASDYVALIAYDREVRSPLDAGGRSPVSVGVGGATGSYGSGLGVGIGINLSGKPKDVVVTRLSVQIRRRADSQPVWEGRAETSAKVGTPASQAGLSAGKLAAALFKDYPGRSGETITVK